MAGWSMSVIVLLMRCFCAPDFQLIEISILAPTPVQEQVKSPLLLSTILTLWSVFFHGCHNQEDSHPYFHHYGNLKFFIVFTQLSPPFSPTLNFKAVRKLMGDFCHCLKIMVVDLKH